MLPQPPSRPSWHRPRPLGLRRARVDAFRVYAMLLVIVGHTEFAIGPSEHAVLRWSELALNVAGRVAVPLFLLLAGEHIGPRFLRNRAPGASGVYIRRLVTLFVGATLFYWVVDIAKLARRRGLGAALA